MYKAIRAPQAEMSPAFSLSREGTLLIRFSKGLFKRNARFSNIGSRSCSRFIHVRQLSSSSSSSRGQGDSNCQPFDREEVLRIAQVDQDERRNMLEAYREACARMGGAHNLDVSSSSAPDFGEKFLSRLGRGRWSSSNEVFANNELNLGAVDVIGFDYDYTLVSYTNSMQAMIYDKALERMVRDYGYPRRIGKQLVGGYDPKFAVRGLTFDSSKGLIVKLNSSFEVAADHAFRGRERISRDEVIALYGEGSRHVSKEYMRKHMRGMYDLFSLAETTLLADVIQSLRDARVKFSFVAVSEDVKAAISGVHGSGDLHREVMENVEKYVHPSPKLKSMLRDFREKGKVLFLLSNSGFPFIDKGMQYVAGPEWTDLFDATMTTAKKPSFYSDSAPFRAILKNKRTGDVQESFRPIHALRRGHAYSRGNLRDLVSMLDLDKKRVLYFGDHLYADLVEPTKKLGWRTGAIIREIEHELAMHDSPEFRKLHWKTEMLEQLMRQMQALGTDCEAHVLDDLQAERAAMLLDMDKMYNENFGSVFTSGLRKTLLAGSVERYADVYTSRVENFLSYSPMHRFIPTGRQNFAHEPPSDSYFISKLLANPHDVP